MNRSAEGAPQPAAPPPAPPPPPVRRAAAPPAPAIRPGSTPVVQTIDWSSGRPLSGRYRQLSKLGEGGMGTVWLCDDLLLRRKVALKTLFADRHQIVDEDLERFRREVAIAHAVNHPNVARTYDLGEAASVHYLTMEFLEGQTLVSRLKSGGPMDAAEVRAFAVPLCRGLRAAHVAGVVHRDLKPANIMLVADSRRVVVMDFGIAAAIEDPEVPQQGLQPLSGAPWEVTSAGRGTPAYMAPEQWQGQRGDARTDIYALGVILYVCLTKKLPYKAASTEELATLHQTAAIPRVAEAVPAVDKDLAALIEQCLAKRPEDRPQSMDAVLDLLERGQRRRQLAIEVAAAAAALAAVLLVVGGGLWTLAHDAVVREMRPAQARLAELIALQLDARDLDQIQRPGDEKQAAYQRVHAVLQRYHRQSESIQSIYVMKPAARPGHYTSVVDLYPHDHDRDGDGQIAADERGSLPGDDYDGSEVPNMAAVAQADGPLADTDFVADKWGLSLSGFATVRQGGQRTAYFVGVDQNNAALARFKATLWLVLAVAWLASMSAVAVWRMRTAGRRSSAAAAHPDVT